MTVLALALVAAFSIQPTDEKKTATALLTEASRLEAARQYDAAIDRAQKALDKGAAEGRSDVAARALQIIGRCHQWKDPEDMGAASSAFERIEAEFGDQAELAAWAQARASYRGVDVWLEKFAEHERRTFEEIEGLQLFLGRERSRRAESDSQTAEARGRIAELKESVGREREALRAKVVALDRAAGPGLIQGLAKADERTRRIAEELLAEVVDEAGIAALVAGLTDDRMRPGAALALSRVFERHAQARRLEEEARSVEAELAEIKTAPDSERVTERIREAAKALEAKAAGIRKNIPPSLDTPSIQEALTAVLESESAVGAVEAARALESVGEISGPLVETLLTGLSSPDRNVRRACCAAAGAVDPTKAEDKRRLAERLIEIVQKEPELENKPESDFANDAAVRAAAATALGRIGMIRAVPALIEALSDNSADVRNRANDGLVMLTGRDLGYESEPHVEDGGMKDPDPKNRVRMSEAEKRQKQIDLRKKGVDAWTAWWEETSGVVAVVERFWRFQATWRSADPTSLFDRELYLMEVRSGSAARPNAEERVARAERIVNRFQERKEFLQQDALDAGPEAAPKLLPYLSGILEGQETGLTTVLRDKSRAATRMFVAETLAKLAGRGGGSLTSDLRDRVAGGATKEEKAGAALALGFLPKEGITSQDREVLERRGLEAAEGEVRAAAAQALARVGDRSNAQGLARVASNNGDHERSQIWALRALAAVKASEPEIIRSVGELVGHVDEAGTVSDRKSVNPLVREAACDTLSQIGDASSVGSGHLLRARVDLAPNVREAAGRAIRAIGERDPRVAESVMAVVKDLKRPSLDRAGAALALGDLGQPAYLDALLDRLVDRNPPILVRDPDTGVRSSVCRALAAMGARARIDVVGEKLIQAMAGEEGAEQVRREAYAALKGIAGGGVPEFVAADTGDKRAEAVKRVREWWDREKSSWPRAAR